MSRSRFPADLLTRLVAAFRGPVKPAAVHLAVDVPEPQSVSVGTLVIHGWAFSRDGRIVDVQARLGNRSPRALAYGFRRPDVARAFGNPSAEQCGFQATIVFEPTSARVEHLAVRATDERGQTAEVRIPVRVALPPRVQPSTTAADTADYETKAARDQPPRTTIAPDIEKAIARARGRADREPTILDWHTGLPLAAAFPHLIVFSPPTDATVLPYLDRTVDVIVINANEPARLSEAQRVAALAMIEIREDATLDNGAMASLSWSSTAPEPPSFPTTTIVIPAHNEVKRTDACLTQVMATLPSEFRGEILVVDDASSDDTPAVLSRWAATTPLIRILRSEENVGFLRSCNRAAETATGEFLVFLNNDTAPQPGWLSPLLRVFRDCPSAGAVGGKLLYPDGTLQEAGGVIFSDGSGCNFGKHDPHPDAPLYSFVREVDYCSAALLAIRRARFLEIGGFDERFSPAYYEDTDLCFRLRERGYRVYYQPEAVVVHVEGTSSGTDIDAGVKQHQAINRATFVERWQTVLTTQPPPPARLDAAARIALAIRDDRPRALVCAPRLPEHDRESGSRRIHHLIEFLHKDGWAVSFVAMDSIAGERYVRALQQRGVATYAGPDSPLAGEERVDDLDWLIANGRFNLAVLAFWDIAERLLPRLRLLTPGTRAVVDSIDLHFLRSARQVLRRSPGHVRGMLQFDYADRMIREINSYAAADAVLTVSQKEADYVNDLTADATLARAVPDAEDVPQSPLPFCDRHGVLFVGNFRHSPNLEGLEYLCAEILPRLDPALRARHPLYLVGNELNERVLAVVAGLPHVRIVGWVPSLQPYLERARVSVIPLLHGAGTKRKLVQALMAGTPSVSTPIGIEGLQLEDGRHVLVADTAERFAAQMTRLMDDPALWGRLAAEGRTLVERHHGIEATQNRFRSVIDDVMAQAASA